MTIKVDNTILEITYHGYPYFNEKLLIPILNAWNRHIPIAEHINQHPGFKAYKSTGNRDYDYTDMFYNP